MTAYDAYEPLAPWDGRRVPLTLIGGYLGSGKTTVLNELLARTDRPIAILVNDVGEINIDAGLLRRRQADTIELTNGCVCCSLSEGLGVALQSLRDRDTAPDHVIIELSGVADPLAVLPWSNSDGFRLEGVVVVVDADQFLDRIDDERTAPLLMRQLTPADVLVLSKTDLAGTMLTRQVTARLAELVPDAPIVRSERAGASTLLDLGTRRGRDVAVTAPPTLFDPHRIERHVLPRPCSETVLAQILDDLPADTVRAKGVAETETGERLLVQLVGRRRTISTLPEAEDQEPTDLIVVGI